MAADDRMPDPDEVAMFLEVLAKQHDTPEPRRRMFRAGSRYIFAGLDLAREISNRQVAR